MGAWPLPHDDDTLKPNTTKLRLMRPTPVGARREPPPAQRRAGRKCDRSRRGFGRRLISHAEEEARRLGFAAIELYTHELMSENIALYQRLGYEEFARQTEKGYNRVYMRKQLRAPGGA